MRTIWVALTVVSAVACIPGSDRDAQGAAAADIASLGSVRPLATGGDLVQGDTVPGLPSWTHQDWEVLQEKVAWAWQNGVDTLAVGDRIARIGVTFLDTPYLPRTLDPPGPERLVVTEAPRDVLDQPERAMQSYQKMITRIRYRGGRLAGYPSRLHYFTDWLLDNEQRGLIEIITADLGGSVDSEPISFMTSHRDLYPQLVDDQNHLEIGRAEGRLNTVPRYYIIGDEIAAAADQIEDGDILAMATTVAGLDVAHTGIALWKDGELHLMNAPLVGKSVQISEKGLSDRLLGITSQDGVMVARPLEQAPLVDGN
jgi:hypothetical protein